MNMYTESAPTVLRNQTVLNNLPDEVYSVEANEKTPDDCRYPLSVSCTESKNCATAQNTVQKVYVKFFDSLVGLKAMTASHFSKQHSWVRTEESKTKFPIKKCSMFSPITRS